MKKLTLALVLTLCGARVYGQLPQEEIAINAEQIQALNAALETAVKDTKSIDAVCQELGLQKEEVKGWFARHKVLTGAGSLLVVYATLLGLSCCGQEAQYSNGKLTTDLGSLKKGESVTKMIQVRNALSKLAFLQKPIALAASGGQAGYAKFAASKNKVRNSMITLAIAALVLFAGYEIYQGKDSAFFALCNKLFGKKEVAPAVSEVVAEPAAQPVAEEVAKAEVPATTTEVVAPAAA
jgi:hypothetical protein